MRRWHPKTGDSTKGKVLTDDKGMTVYVFDDSGGKSACNGPCAGNWPPLTLASQRDADGRPPRITRDHGSKQWAYKGECEFLHSLINNLAPVPQC